MGDLQSILIFDICIESILPDSSNASNAPPPQTNPHACSKPFTDVTDYNLDLSQLIATCQRHTV